MSLDITKCRRGGKIAPVENYCFRRSYFFPLHPVPSSVIPDHKKSFLFFLLQRFLVFFFLISERFYFLCQRDSAKSVRDLRALISLEVGHRIIWFHRTHMLTDVWLCAKMVLSVRMPGMNQTWPIDPTCKVWRGERQTKRQNTKTSTFYVKVEEAVVRFLGDLGRLRRQGRSAQDEEAIWGRAKGTSGRSWSLKGSQKTRRRWQSVLMRWCQYIFKCGPQAPSISITGNNCSRWVQVPRSIPEP